MLTYLRKGTPQYICELCKFLKELCKYLCLSLRTFVA